MIKMDIDEVWKEALKVSVYYFISIYFSELFYYYLKIYIFFIYVYSLPNAKGYRYARIPLFDKFVCIFWNDRATGKWGDPHVDNLDEINKEATEQINDEELEV